MLLQHWTQNKALYQVLARKLTLSNQNTRQSIYNVLLIIYKQEETLLQTFGNPQNKIN